MLTISHFYVIIIIDLVLERGNIMIGFGKIHDNSQNEDSSNNEIKLLDSAFKLFTEKSVKETSIQEIVDGAAVGKGTFYHYFKDKEEIRDVLIAKKSERLFNDAIEDLNKNYIQNLSDQIIFIINHVINALSKNTILLRFISRNLSFGIYNKTISKLYDNDKKQNAENSIYSLFMKGLEKNNIKLENPEVTLYMIIELVSSTCFNSILYNEPLPIEDYKPYLYSTIRKLIESEN